MKAIDMKTIKQRKLDSDIKEHKFDLKHYRIITPVEATKSVETLRKYLNQNSTGMEIIQFYMSLSNLCRKILIHNINRVLPYVYDNSSFINTVKDSMRKSLCRTLEYDCLLNDYTQDGFICTYILTNEGYRILSMKYQKELREYRDERYQEDMDSFDYVLYDTLRKKVQTDENRFKHVPVTYVKVEEHPF